jgi:cell division transport system permease protein
MSNSLKTAFTQIRRTPYQAMAAVMVLSLTFFAITIFAFIFFSAYKILQYFESAPQVIAFFEKGQDLKEEEIAAIKSKLTATGKLASFKYVSTREAEAIYKEKNKNDPLLLELVDYKILPPSIEISATEITALKGLKDILASQPKITDIVFYEDIVQTLSTWVVNLRLIGLLLIAYLAFQSILILVLIVSLKILAKKEEIEILRLLGASFGFIAGPFIYESIIYGISGAILGFVVAASLFLYSTPLLVNWLADIPILPISYLLLLGLLGIEIVAGMFLGMIASLWGVRRFLRD